MVLFFMAFTPDRDGILGRNWLFNKILLDILKLFIYI